MSVLESLAHDEETLWLNPNRKIITPIMRFNGYGFIHIKAAQARFMRFLPYIASAFPDAAERKGNIESALIPIPKMKDWLNAQGAGITGNLYLKDDAHLPIAGSVKARGGIHEVLQIAETLAFEHKMLLPTDKYDKIDSDEFREFYSHYTIQAGSTGNLGISIGRTAAKLGFHTVIHMSSDAKQWKKDLLRSEGVDVREYDDDYAAAVAKGREASASDPNSFFIDDENSTELFFGYSSVAFRLKVQLFKAGISVNEDHPLFVYLPCGVGGAPGGITFGLRVLMGNDVHCFFAEPTQAPCFTYAMESGKYGNANIHELGLTGKTIADGLAVPNASGFVCKMMDKLVSGSYTLKDEKLPVYMEKLLELEGIRIEPSACAGFDGPARISVSEYIDRNGLADKMQNATHIIWATGGGLMPEE